MPTRKILTYNPEGVRQILLPFFQHDLSACYKFSIWLKHLGIVLYAVILSIILAYEFYPDGEMGAGPACADGKNLNMLFEVTLADAKLEFRFLIVHSRRLCSEFYQQLEPAPFALRVFVR